MKPLYIPKLGEIVTLAQPWTFQLFNESRNETMMELQGDKRPWEADWRTPVSTRVVQTGIPVTLPAGTQLKLDRYYIRKGLKQFDSVTFFYVGQKVRVGLRNWNGHYITPAPPANHTTMRSVRFWAKLDDVNTMVIV